jgi:hypothetical protein
MGHFAKLDENNIVTQVIVVDNKDITDPFTGQEDEILGIAFCKKLLGGKWVQTSYNGNIRKRYAGVNYSYNKALDAFVPPAPFDSWVLVDETADWEAPLGPAPELTEEEIEAGSRYQWNEEAYQEDNTTGWELITPEPPAED